MIVSAAIAEMLDITPNAAQATMQPKADAAASVVAPSLVLRRLTVTLRFILSSRIARGELGRGVGQAQDARETTVFGGLPYAFIAIKSTRADGSALQWSLRENVKKRRSGKIDLHQGSNRAHPMSALGQKRTSRSVEGMSALPPKADIAEPRCDVRFVPKADITRCRKSAFIRSPRWQWRARPAER